MRLYLAEHADIETAERFLESTDESFSDLARHPGMGTALSLHDLKLTGLRKWRVNGFESFLIFYLPRRGGILSCGFCMLRKTRGAFLESYEARPAVLQRLHTSQFPGPWLTASSTLSEIFS